MLAIMDELKGFFTQSINGEPSQIGRKICPSGKARLLWTFLRNIIWQQYEPFFIQDPFSHLAADGSKQGSFCL